ncbi:IS200/IS605 family transposase [Serratia marcescens]|nr:IS200/IS605 family transposase [Serratia marcescens]
MFWRCKYYLVWTPKYRFKILRDKVGKEPYRTIYIVCNMKDCEVLELNIQPDHVYLVVIAPPEAIDFDVDGRPERTQCNRALQSFPTYTKEIVWQSFWARGYFVDTIGVNEEIIRRYVKHQDKKDQETEQQMGLLQD